MWQQGDVIVEKVEGIKGKPLKHLILAKGGEKLCRSRVKLK